MPDAGRQVRLPNGATVLVDSDVTDAQAYRLAMRAGLIENEQRAYGLPQGLTDALAQGASLGFSDELAALGQAVSAGPSDWKQFSEYYRSSLEDTAARRKRFEAQHGGAALGAGLAGGLATGLYGVGKLALTKTAARMAKASLPARYAGIVAANTALGAGAGVGAAAPGERLQGAALGAVFGGALGAAVPPLAAGAGKVVDVLSKPVAALANRLRSPREYALRKIAEALGRDETTPGMMAANLRKLGPMGAPVEAAGANLMALGDLASITPGKAKNAATKLFIQRAKTSGKRMASALLDSFRLKNVDFHGALQGLNQRMRMIGREYDEVLNSGAVPMTEQLQKLMGADSVKAGLRAANSIVSDDIALGRADDAIRSYFSVTPQGEVTLIKEPTLRVWDYVKRGLDAVVHEGTDAITGKLNPAANRALDVKRQLLGYIDDINPDYKQLRAAYADEKTRMDAMQLGRLFMREDAEVTAERLRGMGDVEQEFFRLGAARAMWDRVLSAANPSTAFRVFANGPMVARLREVYPDNKAYAKFMRALKNEATFARTKNVVGGGSRTAEREALKEDIGIDPTIAADVARGALRWGLADTMRQSLKGLTDLPEGARDELAMLFSVDPSVKAMLLQRLGALGSRIRPLPPWFSPATKQGALAAASMAGGGALGGQ